MFYGVICLKLVLSNNNIHHYSIIILYVMNTEKADILIIYQTKCFRHLRFKEILKLKFYFVKNYGKAMFISSNT